MVLLNPVVPFLIGVVCITGICWYFLRRRIERFLLVYAWSVGLFIAVLALGTDPNAAPVVTLKYVAVLSGVVLLGAGWFLYDRPHGHLMAIAGWQGLGIYWMVELGNYLFLHPEDPTNVILYAPALALFSVFCLHEWDTFKGARPRRSLKFMAGMTFVASGTYFLFAMVPPFSTALIWATAAQTSYLVNLFGMHTALGAVSYDTMTGEISVPILGSGISIILACTAIEAMVIFFGAFLTVEPREHPWEAYKKLTPRMKEYMKMSGRERRSRALLYTIVPIWVLNLVRNIAIIWLVNNTGISFDVAHGYIGKGFSFLVLLGLAMVVFDLVPEIYDDLLDVYRLGKPQKETGTEKEREKGSVGGGKDAGDQNQVSGLKGPGTGDDSGKKESTQNGKNEEE